MLISISIRCPSWVSRAVKVATPILLIASAGVAFSAPTTFTAGQTLKAADLNAAFANVPTTADLNTAVAKLPTTSEWTSYTVAVTAGTTPVTTTVDGAATSTGYYRRVGDTLEVMIDTVFPACSAAGQLEWSLPTGLTPDAGKLPGAYTVVGSAIVINATTATTKTTTVSAQIGWSTPAVALERGSTTGGMTCADIGNGGGTRMRFSIPIQGWTLNN